MNLYDYLQTIPLFSEMTNEELKTLEQSMVVQDYPDDYSFKCEDKDNEELYVILDGNVEVTHEKHSERGQQSVSTMGPGSLLGLHHLIGHFRPVVSCHANGPVKAAHLPGSAFNLLYKYNTRLPHHFQMVVAKQLAADYRNIVADLKLMMQEDSVS